MIKLSKCLSEWSFLIVVLMLLGTSASAFFPQYREFAITKVNVQNIAGKFLGSTTTPKSLVSCQRQCVLLNSCIYTVADKPMSQCSFYSSGNGSVSTINRQVYYISSVNEQVT